MAQPGRLCDSVEEKNTRDRERRGYGRDGRIDRERETERERERARE